MLFILYYTEDNLCKIERSNIETGRPARTKPRNGNGLLAVFNRSLEEGESQQLKDD